MVRLVEDRALLDGFRRGDRQALGEVYREYVRPLSVMISKGFTFDSAGQARRFAGYRDPYLVENLLQETFARAFAPAARQAYDGLRPYRNYLFTIARNLVIDSLRGGSLELVPGDPDQAQAEDRPADAIDGIAAAELQRHCEAFVASLDPAERALFELRFHAGESVEVSARRLRISEHQVKRRERVLKKRFFLRMKEHGYFEGYRSSREVLERVGILLVFFAGTRG